MEIQTKLAQAIDKIGQAAKYDKSVKILLGNKAILAWILKSCVKEFEPFEPQTIMECIEKTPDIAVKAVHKDTADAKLDGNLEIEGANTESASTTEKTIYYDIRFVATVPNTKKVIHLIINVEVQLDTSPGYLLETRVVYYLSRLISNQYGKVFTHSEYGKIEKVYSIWICPNAPNYKKNTITGISLKNDVIFGKGTLRQNAVDLMQGIIINLGKADSEVDNDILKLMNTLLSTEVSEAEKKKLMSERFNIAMTEELEREVSDMCNLSQGVRAEGRAEGRIEGRVEGILNLLIELVQDKVLTVADAAKRANMSEDDFTKKYLEAKDKGVNL